MKMIISGCRISVNDICSYEVQALKGKNVTVNLSKYNQKDNCN